MIGTSSYAIGFYQRWDVGRLSSVMVSYDNLWTVFPFPTNSTGTRRGVDVFGVEQGAWSK
jgi:hypothetical protein